MFSKLGADPDLAWLIVEAWLPPTLTTDERLSAQGGPDLDGQLFERGDDRFGKAGHRQR